jgi:hypothetical protein
VAAATASAIVVGGKANGSNSDSREHRLQSSTSRSGRNSGRGNSNGTAKATEMTMVSAATTTPMQMTVHQ